MRTYLRTAVAVSLFASLAAGTNAAASTAMSLHKLTATQILNISLSAARAQKSVDSLVTTSIFGLTAKVQTQSGASSGRSLVNVNGHSGEVLEVHGTVFAKLDAVMVNFEFHTSAPSLANKWISVPRQSRYFSTISTGITLASVLDELTPVGALTQSITNFNGVHVVALSGSANSSVDLPGGTQILYVSTKAPFLPVGGRVHLSASGVNLDLAVRITHWGVPLRISAPSTFTKISATTLK